MDPGGEAVCTGERTVSVVCAFKTKQAKEMVGALKNTGREGEKLRYMEEILDLLSENVIFQLKCRQVQPIHCTAGVWVDSC